MARSTGSRMPARSSKRGVPAARYRPPRSTRGEIGGNARVAVTYLVRMRALTGQEQAVQELLLSNVERIRSGESGNLAFAVHRSRRDAREFWLYETWTDEQAVAEH